MAETDTELDTDVDETTESAEEPKPRLTLEVKIAEPSACQRHVTVTVSREDIDRYLGNAFDEIKVKAEVPGFRVGRAPRKLVESRFREQVSEQVKGSLLMDCLTQINEDHQFTAISEPDFDFEVVTIPEDGPMTFEFNIEVRPEFAMPVWQGLSLERPVHTYTSEDVDRQMKQLLSRFGELTPIDGPAEADDVVIVNITSRLGDKVLAVAQEQEIRVKPILSFGDARLENFDKLMIGAKSADRKIAKIKVSEDAESAEIRGQEVEVEFEVLDVKRLELPVMNKAFLEKIGGFSTEQEVREAVKDELERQLTYHQQRRVRQQITALLTASASWELPQSMLRKQAKRELDRAVMELRSSGFSDDQIRTHANELRQNSLTSTATALKEHFILERIAKNRRSTPSRPITTTKSI